MERAAAPLHTFLESPATHPLDNGWAAFAEGRRESGASYLDSAGLGIEAPEASAPLGRRSRLEGEAVAFKHRRHALSYSA